VVYKNYSGTYGQAERVPEAGHDEEGVPVKLGYDNYLNIVEEFLTR